MKGLDLSGLDQFNSAELLEGAGLDSAASGKPLLIPLEKISPDPDQPRKEFDDAKLDELAASIRERGVKSPISVKPANEDGIYLINYGERRYLASDRAGKTEIPAFIDDDHDDFDQAIENIQREALTPLEIAHFIDKRLKAGDKKGTIAKRLGKPASFVSDHAVFFQLPDCVRDLYDSSRCRDIQALAALYRAAKKFPADVEFFCQGDRKLSQQEVKTFVAGLKEQKSLPPTKTEASEGVTPGAEEKEPSVADLTAGTSAPVAGTGSAAEPLDSDLSDPDSTDLEADLYQQFEEHLKPLEDYLNNVSDSDFRSAAGARLRRLAEKYGR